MADIGVLGGSGFYSFLADARPVEVETPFGPPSEPPVVGSLGGREVAFIPRHGADHRFPPHRVNYRANLWALRALGVRQVLAPCAVGSLRPELVPGTFLVPDQYVDRTWGRPQTVYDDLAVHTTAADPYCPTGREAVIATGNVVPTGTLVVINGPRFSTRAESQWHAAQGWSVVGMTGAPEAALARELALCYTSIALVTDHDAGTTPGEGVTADEVFKVFAHSLTRLQALLTQVITTLPTTPTCPCQHTLDNTPAASSESARLLAEVAR
ncbi:S-methyl-5'-thioadenosine phosphorylase [Kribbella sandramycini]|uniref:S-methyl-5'-thioadenosine phosphorylase n=1 Tax=Kribbella sandramycini TaxID=60450 RepID=A0A7Y4L768_9ACTN|nr:S-methyl-5'-thioadenosine phosphorylase [Kribbella sandramycini]MBB6570205.1 5'-methylthioadenosine phosphorylase [Kribbella sandramycini]NOL45670.1 S-methyl-5'-thioadenosine phosphorylase [Kribbella sandramycini]